MANQVSECVLLGFLFILAWIDLKKKEVPVILAGACGAEGLWISCFLTDLSWGEMLGGSCVGGILLLSALATRESIGVGDGLVFCATGLYLGLWQNIELLLLAAVSCGAVGGVLLLGRKCTRKERLPFLPFVLAAWVGMLALGG
ncbi:MAG: prepilin peptidase [Clostridiales bacterium]|nr:prepilin peptidase [Clostridiales bacterium]